MSRLRDHRGAAARETHQRERERETRGTRDDDQQQRTSAGEPAYRKGKPVEDKNQEDGCYQRSGGEDGHATQRHTQTQPLMQLVDIEVEPVLIRVEIRIGVGVAHASSLCVPR